MKKRFLILLTSAVMILAGCGKTAPVQEKLLCGISLNTENVKKEFVLNETFTHDGLIVTAIYSDDSTLDVSSKATFSPLDVTSTVGVKEVTVSYTEALVTKTQAYTVTVKNNQPVSAILTSISINTDNVKKEFKVNDEFTYEGLVVTAHYSDFSSKEVTPDNVTTPKMSTPGDKSVVVTYTENGVTKSAEYDIKVTGDEPPAKKALVDISLNLDNVQRDFEVGERFNYDGLIVTALYDDESSSVVTPTNVSNPDMSTKGTKTVTVTYYEDGITKSKTYSITVTEEEPPVPAEKTLVGINLNVDNVKVKFMIGDIFTYEGLVVIASYDDLSTAKVTPTSVSSPDMLTAGEKTVIVTYTEKDVTKTGEYGIVVRQSTPATQEDILNAEKQVREAFNNLDIEDYTVPRWNAIIDKLNNTLDSLKRVSTKEEIEDLVDSCIDLFTKTPKAWEITKGTLFNKHSSESNYEFDRDEDNNLVISYPGNPGHWVYCGTDDNLITDINENNIFRLTFSNDIDEEIEVCLQLQNADGYKSDSGVLKIPGNSEYMIELKYEVDVTRLFFFLDSCNDNHNRSGKVTILKTEFDYDGSTQKLREPKYIPVNKALSRADLGADTYYTLKDEDAALSIERISFEVKVDFNGNDSGGRWFAMQLYAGSTKSEQLKESVGYSQDLPDNAGARYIFNVMLDGTIMTGQQIHLQVAYGVGPDHEPGNYNELSYTLIGYTLHYTMHKNISKQTIDVNQYVYKDGSGYKDGDKEKEYLTAEVPYSSIISKSRVQKIDVNFTTVNTASYGKSQLYFTGFDFTEFGSGNNNVLNIGSKMSTDGSGTPTSGTMTLYPTKNVILEGQGSIKIVCWWASALDIKIDSIDVYTDLIAPPEAVTNLEAHPIDSGVVLTWTAGLYASNYDVYMDNSLIGNVITTYMTVNELVNGNTYSFEVVAKNSSGESEPVSCNGTPQKGATYDTFIENLNTPFEQELGQEKVAKVLEAGNAYIGDANNYRLKKTIEKMQNGEETTIAFLGGSITVGEKDVPLDERGHQKGYAYHTYQWLKRNYDVANKSHFVNVGISGTGSEVGICRAQEDIIEHEPDLIFIEYAANNGSTNFFQASYESLIRDFLNLPQEPAVVLVFSCCTYTTGPSCSENLYMKGIGQYYGLPMYSHNLGLRAICTPSEETIDGKTVIGDEIFAKYSNDGTHPNDYGHQLYAKGLAYFLRSLITKDIDDEKEMPLTPSVANNDKFCNFINVNNESNNEIIKSLGSFVAADTGTHSTREDSDTTAFQHGWKKTDSSANEAMVIEVNAKNFALVYEAGNPSVQGDPHGNIVVTFVNKNNPEDNGELTWDVSKINKQSHSGSTEITEQRGNGWQNPVSILIFDKLTAGDYIITISMDPNNNGICTIMGFGYSR